MRIVEILVLGIMLIAIPITVMGNDIDAASLATQEGGDLDEQTHP